VLVAHYDGLLRPLEIRFRSIDLWVRLYDLPAAMMKPSIVQRLGGQLGEVLKFDRRFPWYLRIRVRYSLGKPLRPSLAVKVKGRGEMVIALKYENVPHFCFSCGQIGHAAANCEDNSETHGMVYGELRASPPRQTKEITVKTHTTRAARPLFQVTDMPARGQYVADRTFGCGTTSMVGDYGRRPMSEEEASKQDEAGEQFDNVMKELHDACNFAEASWAAKGSASRERVSFGANMTIEDESSDGGSVEQKSVGQLTAIERFHARKFKHQSEATVGKRAVLKITGAGSSKKQCTPVKKCMKEALGALVSSEETGRMMGSMEAVEADQQEMDTTMEASPSTDQQEMNTAMDESRQEK
jgi:hypothetical protein